MYGSTSVAFGESPWIGLAVPSSLRTWHDSRRIAVPLKRSNHVFLLMVLVHHRRTQCVSPVLTTASLCARQAVTHQKPQ